jgi:hypothetical protein
MPIDYSKWDNIEDSDSDNEQTTSTTTMLPQVTRLDAPSKVTFGGGSDTIVAEPSGAVAAASVSTNGPTSTTTATATKKESSTAQTNPTTSAAAFEYDDKFSSWTKQGGLLHTKDDHRELYWSQDRYSLTIRLQLLEGEKVMSVQVENILPYTERFTATGTTKPKLTVYGTDSKTAILVGELPHPVHSCEDDDDGIDWTIETLNDKKFVTVTFYKAVPMQGLFIWWKRPLQEYPEIDIERSSSEEGSKEFLKAWEEAHRLFKDKKKEKQELPL